MIVTIILGAVCLAFAIGGLRTGRHNGALRVLLLFMAWFAGMALLSWLYMSAYVFPEFDHAIDVARERAEQNQPADDIEEDPDEVPDEIPAP